MKTLQPESPLVVRNSRQVPRLLFLKALVGLLAFDLYGYSRDFRKLYRYVKNSPVSPRECHQGVVEEACKAVNYACVWYPKHVLCLQRSAVLTCLLRDCGVAAEMVMGAQIMPFKAHAWTEVEGKAINERRDVTTFYSALERC